MDAAAAPFPLGRLPDGPLSHIAKKCTPTDDWQSLSLTSQRMCRLVRSSRRFRLRLGLQQTQQLQQVPASRAFKQVESLSVTLEPGDLQQGCWDTLAGVLASSVQRWPDIQEVGLLGSGDFGTEEEEDGCLASPLAALKGATALRKLSFINVLDNSDFPHLEQLTQVTALHMDDGSPHSMPLLLEEPVRAPLAALTNLRHLQLPFHCCLTQEDMEPADDHWDCPLALPPNLTSLLMERIDCSEGAFWRHIAACSGLVELGLPDAFQPLREGVRDHPSWALHELAGSLGRLKRLVISMGGSCSFGDMARLLDLLYVPQAEGGPQEEVATGSRLARMPVPVAGMEMFTSGSSSCSMMVPPPNMAAFSCLEVLEVAGSIHDGWWLMASAPHHWQALAGCTALRQLQGLHASQPPPATVSFPGVTRLGVTVAPGDTVGVLGAFPALRDLKITSVLKGNPAQVRPAAPEVEQPQLGEPPPAVPQLSAYAGVTRLELDLHTFRPVYRSSSAASSSSSTDLQAVAEYCSELWRALPGLTDVELVCNQGLPLPSLAALTGLTSLTLPMQHRRPGTVEDWAGVVADVAGMLQGTGSVEKLVLSASVPLRDMSQDLSCAALSAHAAALQATCLAAARAFQVGEGSWAQVAQQLHRVLPKLQQLELQCKRII